MELTPWDPWAELGKVRAETNLLWNQFLKTLRPREPNQTSIAFLPDVDFIETRDDYRIYLAVPGLVEEDIEILVQSTGVTVRGERYCPYDPKRDQNQLAEWRYGYFERHIAFPHPINDRQWRASYDAGVLILIVEKS